MKCLKCHTDVQMGATGHTKRIEALIEGADVIEKDFHDVN